MIISALSLKFRDIKKKTENANDLTPISRIEERKTKQKHKRINSRLLIMNI